MKQRGFTLIELLFGLIVSGVLAHLAVPSFKGLLESQQRQNAAQTLAAGLRYARTEAIARNRTVVIHALEYGLEGGARHEWPRSSGRRQPGPAGAPGQRSHTDCG